MYTRRRLYTRIWKAKNLIRISAASVQERLVFEKYFFNSDFAATIQERLLIESDLYWRAYGIRLFSLKSQFKPWWYSFSSSYYCIFCRNENLTGYFQGQFEVFGLNFFRKTLLDFFLETLESFNSCFCPKNNVFWCFSDFIGRLENENLTGNFQGPFEDVS